MILIPVVDYFAGVIMKSAVENFQKSLKATAGASFNASRRLDFHDKRLTRLTAFVSAYVIILTIFPYFLEMSEKTRHLYDFVTVVFAIVILIASLLQYSNNNVGKAEQHHRCGLEINELLRQLSLEGDDITKAELGRLMKVYGDILQKYSINHDEIDYRQYQLDRPQDHDWMTRSHRLLARIEIFRRRVTPDFFLLVATTVAFAVLLWAFAGSHVVATGAAAH